MTKVQNQFSQILVGVKKRKIHQENKQRKKTEEEAEEERQLKDMEQTAGITSMVHTPIQDIFQIVIKNGTMGVQWIMPKDKTIPDQFKTMTWLGKVYQKAEEGKVMIRRIAKKDAQDIQNHVQTEEDHEKAKEK